MKSLGLTLLALLSFASNSILCRLALKSGAIDPVSFTSIRLASGALVLGLLILWPNRQIKSKGSWLSALMLFSYAAAFSYAYVSLKTGTGALILFGSVQVSMLSLSIAHGEKPGAAEWLGLFIGIGGLVFLVMPGLNAPPLGGALLMALAGTSWGVYSWRGRGVAQPAVATAWNFVLSLPFALFVTVMGLGQTSFSGFGMVLAIVSGAITSGLGYVAWYSALRHLSGPKSAVVQLSVPILAGLGGIAFLDEALTPRLAIAAAITLGGVSLAIFGKKPPKQTGRSEVAAAK